MKPDAHCYRVYLPTTNLVKDTARHGDTYIAVDHGAIFVIATSMRAVAMEFPQARSIIREGIGFPIICEEKREDSTT